MDWTVATLEPMDEIFNFMLNENNNAKAVYTKDDGGVNTGLLFLKPSEQEFERLKAAYINTPYDEATGWNGAGRSNAPGEMGVSGLLSYLYSNDATGADSN